MTDQKKPSPAKQLPAINNLQSPLLGKDSRDEAMKYGFSFDSKKVAQGPTFFNLRIMCHCLGIAMRRHLDFSRGFWFLDDLTKETEEPANFSYKFKKDLKLEPRNNDSEEEEESDDDIEEREVEELDCKEIDLVDQIRKDELYKMTLKREKERISSLENKKHVLNNQLAQKEKHLKELSELVQRMEEPSPQM